MKKVASILIPLALLVIGLVVGRIWGRNTAEIPVETKVDTLTIYETKVVEKPVFVYSRIVDTMRVAVVDTIVRNDTAWVSLPREQRVYEDSTYTAWVSGYEPSLDSLRQVVKTVYITESVTEVPRKHRIFVSVEGWIQRNPALPLTANYGFGGNGTYELYGGIGYDPIQKSVCGRVGAKLTIFSW